MKRVKKVSLMVLLFLLLLSCSLLNVGGSFSPPTWIIGTWTDALDVTSYVFESSNVKQVISGITINFGLAYGSATITETSNDTLYSFTIDQSGSAATYSFDKTSASTVNYTVTAGGVTSAALELTKE